MLGMKQLDILLPFALPPADMVTDLLRHAAAPGLAWLAGKAPARDTREVDPYARALPSEYWFAAQAGMSAASGNSPAVATTLMQRYHIPADEGFWFILHPAHVHLAMNHLAITDIGVLDLDDTQSRQLYEAARPLFIEAGLTLVYGDNQTWFVRADAWQDLVTASPGIANGRNMDLWLPQGDSERAWRRLHNELQMLWHTHPVNAALEKQGSKSVNGLWLWGGARAALQREVPAYDYYVNLGGWQTALVPGTQQVSAKNLETVPVAGPQRILITDDRLAGPALAGEWGDWLAALASLDADWLTPAVDALRRGGTSQVSLIMTGEDRMSSLAVRRSANWLFWRKPSLAVLAP